MSEQKPGAIEPLAGEHWSDCASHNEPALPAGPCDCGIPIKDD